MSAIRKPRFDRARVLVVVGISLLLASCTCSLPFLGGQVSTTETEEATQPAVEETSPPQAVAPTETQPAQPQATEPTLEPEVAIISLIVFSEGLQDWFHQIWFQEADTQGEVTIGPNGVTFTGLQSVSRGGIMRTVEVNVESFSQLIIHAIVTNEVQTLTGTGWNGREAPVAVVVSYTDAEGTVHSGLGEDPTAITSVFWRGFYTLDPEGQSDIINGIKVQQGQAYTFEFDLMTLDPAPVVIHYVALEGAGWAERRGTVSELSLTGYR